MYLHNLRPVAQNPYINKCLLGRISVLTLLYVRSVVTSGNVCAVTTNNLIYQLYYIMFV